jgi:hypothetical protein
MLENIIKQEPTDDVAEEMDCTPGPSYPPTKMQKTEYNYNGSLTPDW